MTKNPTNPLANRSKQLLTTALLELLEENPYQKIQIKELCQRAGVSRPTFYNHYQTVEDILDEYLESRQKPLYNQMQRSLEEGKKPEEVILEGTVSCYEFWDKYADLFQLIQSAGMEDLIKKNIQKMDQYAYQNIGRKINEIGDPEVVDFFISQLTNTYYLLYNLWIRTGRERTPEEMAELQLIFTSPDLINTLAEKFPKHEAPRS